MIGCRSGTRLAGGTAAQVPPISTLASEWTAGITRARHAKAAARRGRIRQQSRTRSGGPHGDSNYNSQPEASISNLIYVSIILVRTQNPPAGVVCSAGVVEACCCLVSLVQLPVTAIGTLKVALKSRTVDPNRSVQEPNRDGAPPNGAARAPPGGLSSEATCGRDRLLDAHRHPSPFWAPRQHALARPERAAGARDVAEFSADR